MEKSPRILRPGTVTVKNSIGEIDFKASYLTTEIKYVRMNTSFGIKQSNKGINSDDNAVLVIDLNDLVATQDGKAAEYVVADSFNCTPGTFTFRGDDTVVFNDHVYIVNKVNDKRGLSNTPQFLEVFLK